MSAAIQSANAAPSATKQDTVPDDAKVGWDDLVSSKGNKFRVKAADYDISQEPDGEVHVVDASGPPFNNVQVYWTSGSEGVPSIDVQNKTGITWYKLAKAPWYSIYTWQLTINCNDTYNYSFKDGTDDTYGINVCSIRTTHEVEFDSSNPTIVSISGK